MLDSSCFHLSSVVSVRTPSSWPSNSVGVCCVCGFPRRVFSLPLHQRVRAALASPANWELTQQTCASLSAVLEAGGPRSRCWRVDLF